MSLDVVTINCKNQTYGDKLKIVERGVRYLPYRFFDSIENKGNIETNYYTEIQLRGKTYSAILFDKVMNTLGKIREKDLLLGVAVDPVISIYYFFDGRTFKKVPYLIRDYVGKDVGLVSIFSLEEYVASLVVTHGLGHHGGLKHHLTPKDVMHENLLQIIEELDSLFCQGCKDKLKKNKNV